MTLGDGYGELRTQEFFVPDFDKLKSMGVKVFSYEQKPGELLVIPPNMVHCVWSKVHSYYYL